MNKKNLAEEHPFLASEWNYEKNLGLKPEDFSAGSNQKVWWKCSVCGCEFPATISHRTRLRKDGTYSGCPDCKNVRTAKRMAERNLVIGESDLKTLYPDISRQWDCEKNGDKPEDYSPYSGRKKWWMCDKGHSYKMAISNRTAQGQDCPYCVGRSVLKGFNDLATLRPDIAADWNFEENRKGPDEYTVFSNQKVSWKCKNGHAYLKVIHEKTRTDGKATGCPYCANKKVLPGYNDLETWCKTNDRTDVLEQWDYSKNCKKPFEYLPHTDKKVFWTCDQNHSYEMRICDKTKDDPYGCPVCSGKQLLIGFNDLKILFPEVADEWDYQKNDASPENHIAGTHKKVWWKCKECGNSYQASIKERTYGGTGCPKCSFYYKTSVPEQAIFFYVKNIFDDAINSFKPEFLNGMEIDIYVPSLKLGIEYDGRFWHSNNERDEKKSRILKSNGIRLIRIKESDTHNNYNDFAIIKSDYRDQLEEINSAIEELFSIIREISSMDIQTDVNVLGDSTLIYSASEENKKERSLLHSDDSVLQEWNYELNGDLTPDKVTPGSRKIVWWHCSNCGKDFQQSIKTKVKGGLMCESCSKTRANEERAIKKIKFGEVKSVADYPLLMKEWNDPRDPASISRGSEYKAHWKCSVCSNEFDMIVKNRTGQNQGCPICGRRKSAKTRSKH